VDSGVLLQAWRSLLPEQVFVTAGPPLHKANPLTERELASAGPVGTHRLRELEIGRVYAKRALAMIGFHGVELPVSADRSPVWPAGALGSLTHVIGRDGGHFAAAVARRDHIGGIGIDIERDDGLNPHLWKQVMTPCELERILALPVPARSTEAQVLWCAKEAVAKAARQAIEPADLEIVRDPVGDGYSAMWRRTIGETVGSTNLWHGRTVRSQGFVLAAVVVPR
jgi:4'-phosphopantetheinyl transferase EntD